MLEKNKKTEQKNPWRFVCMGLTIVGAVNLVGYLAAWLIGNVLGGISFQVTKAATIGIIGGADGPTAVFVTAGGAPVWQPLLWMLLTAAGIWGYLHLNKK